MHLDGCHNLDDLRRLAQRRLPAPIFHYLEGGADDEWTLARNRAAFDDYVLLPRVLRDVAHIDLTTRVLGLELALPLLLSPTGMSRLFHPDREPGVARAAAKFGTLYSLSTLSNASIEQLAAAGAGPKLFQVYVHKDRGLTRTLVDRARAAGFAALCLTVDNAVIGNRERDLVHGMTMTPRFGLRSLWSFASHPRWAAQYLQHHDFTLGNLAGNADLQRARTGSVMEYVRDQYDRTLTWDDAAWLRGLWCGPFVIKGLLTPEDALCARDCGATAIMISNHGGRQLDSSPAPVDCVAPIRDAVGDGLELIVDGGIRRGTHVIKALALGANACSIGRPYLYGLAAGGQAGVERALHLLREELLRDMALLGCRSVTEIQPGHVAAVVTDGAGR